ncbi:MAG TPA: hypothetical protein VLA99_02780 [Nitrospiraceae bacterium]|nr:hypothetical protein [Nitrospiraceae bacterium]
MLSSELLKADAVDATAVLLQKGRLTITAARLFKASAAADVYLQMFDKAAAADVTVGTTVPDWVVMLDSAAGEVSSGDGLPTDGMTFYRGLVVACTTTSTGSTGSASSVRVTVR